MEEDKKNILVVGASGGMGVEVCKKFSTTYNVYGLDIKEGNCPGVTYIKVDVRNEESILQAYDRIRKNVDYIYGIINVVGIYLMDSLLEISNESLKRIIDINCLGIQRVVKIFFPLLRKDSRILITTSEVSTYDPLPFNGIYSITKSFLEKYAFSIRHELNIFGIKVIVYRPGACKTNLLNDSTRSLDEFCNKTKIHRKASSRFRKIVNSVESKSLSTEKNAKIIYKILTKKHPKYAYSKNRNLGLVLLNLLPDRLQVFIVSKIIK